MRNGLSKRSLKTECGILMLKKGAVHIGHVGIN